MCTIKHGGKKEKGGGELEPHPGRKHSIKRKVTRSEAVRLCSEWNATHDPGLLDDKASFMKR
jgi:hypothetical protein